MGRLSLGSTDLKLVGAGNTQIQRISVGTTEIWTAKLLRNLITEDFLTGGVSLTGASYPFWQKRMSFTNDNYQALSAAGTGVYRTGSGGTDSSDGSDFYYHRTPIPVQPWGSLRINTWGAHPSPGIVLFSEASGNQLYAQIGSTAWRIFTGPVGGSKTIVDSGSHSLTVGDVAQFFVDRDGYLVFKYGETVLSRVLLSSIANLPTGRYVGFSMGRGTNRGAEFRAGTTAFNLHNYKINADYALPTPTTDPQVIPIVAQGDSLSVDGSYRVLLPAGTYTAVVLLVSSGYRSDFTDLVVRTSAGDQTLPFNAPDSSGLLDATVTFTVPAGGSLVTFMLKNKSTNTTNRTIRPGDFSLTIY